MNWKGLKIKNDGFTLVELIAAILISSLIVAGILSLFFCQQRAFGSQELIAEMNQNLRAIMDRMTREVRLAGYKIYGSTFNGIATAQADSIQILADLDQNGDTIGANEDVTFTYNSATSQIWRIAGASNLPIADNVTGMNFLYTLKDGTSTSSPGSLADIRKVTISITIRTTYPDPESGQYRAITLTSDITPRNLAL